MLFFVDTKLEINVHRKRLSQDTHGPRKDYDSHIVDEQILNSRILFR